MLLGLLVLVYQVEIKSDPEIPEIPLLLYVAVIPTIAIMIIGPWLVRRSLMSGVARERESCESQPKTLTYMQANQPMVFKPSPSKALVEWLVSTGIMLAGICVMAGGVMLAASGVGINMAPSWIIWPCVTLSIIVFALSTVVFGSVLTPNGGLLQD